MNMRISPLEAKAEQDEANRRRHTLELIQMERKYWNEDAIKLDAVWRDLSTVSLRLIHNYSDDDAAIGRMMKKLRTECLDEL